MEQLAPIITEQDPLLGAVRQARKRRAQHLSVDEFVSEVCVRQLRSTLSEPGMHHVTLTTEEEDLTRGLFIEHKDLGPAIVVSIDAHDPRAPRPA